MTISMVNHLDNYYSLLFIASQEREMFKYLFIGVFVLLFSEIMDSLNFT